MEISSVYAQSWPVQASSEREGERLAASLREQRDSQPTLSEMMKEAKERADQRDRLLKQTKNARQYGDAAMMAYAKLARARNLGEVDAASGYARRQIAQLRAAKRSDSENAGRIQAAINQLQKAVNRAGKKKREISQEKLTASRQKKMEKEKRVREAKRLRHQLRSRQAQRIIRESGYMREAGTDNRIQDQLAASRLELQEQMREISASVQPPVEAAVQNYSAAAAPAVESVPEISVQV